MVKWEQAKKKRGQGVGPKDAIGHTLIVIYHIDKQI